MVNERRPRTHGHWIAVLLVVTIALFASACTSGSSSDSTASETEAEPPATVEPPLLDQACAIDDVLELLQSGLPTYDYEPAGSYEALDISAQVVVTGRLSEAVRTEDSGASFTELSLVDVIDVFDGTERADIDVMAWDAQWTDSAAGDPLAAPVQLDDVHFFAFLTPWSGRRGGWNPGIEGLYVSCGDMSPLQAVIIDGRGPDDPANPTIDQLAALLAAQRAQRDASTATQQPGSEYSDDDLRLLREDAMRANPARVEAIRDALVQFAKGGELEPDEIPLSAEVALGLGAEIDLVIERDQLRDHASWMIERPEGYAQFDGPFSALDVLSDIDTQVVIGEHDHCAGAPLSRPPGFEHHAQVSIQPAEGTIDSCIVWFAVDLFLDPQTLTISAITLALFGP